MIRAAVPLLALALLVPLRVALLEPTTERTAEREVSDLSRVRATGAFATYIGTVFLGSFRTIAVDVLWWNYLNAAEDRRFAEAVEFGELITTLQPRNTEVAALLAHDYIMNIPALKRDQDERWRWIRTGMLLLRDSADTNPRDIHVRQSLAFWALTHRFAPTAFAGVIDEDLVGRYVADDELRRRMELHPKEHLHPAQPPFFTAAEWFTEARELGLDQLRRGTIPYSPMGVSLRPEHMEGFLTYARFLDGMWRWRSGNPEGAKDTFRQEAQRIRKDLSLYSPGALLMQERMAAFLEDLPAAVDLYEAWRRGGPDRPARYREMLRAADRILWRHHTLDRGHVVALLTQAAAVERHALLGEPTAAAPDVQEYDNHFRLATPLRPPGGRVEGTLYPWNLDEDWFEFFVPQPDLEAGPQPPLRMHLRVTAGAAPLHVSVLRAEPTQPTRAGTRLDCWEVPAGNSREWDSEILEPGEYRILMEPAGDPPPDGALSAYTVEWQLGT